MSKDYEKNEEAVSPVVGVMLMLVVTIIIAAVVSAFAGGIVGEERIAPQATFECHISNDGTWGGSAFDLVCLGTSDPIPTSDLKLVTSWKTSNKTSGETVTGGATIVGPATVGSENTQYDLSGSSFDDVYHSPLGFGPGVGDWSQYGSYEKEQFYGNYTLMAGTTMHNSAYGYNPEYGGYGISPSTRFEYSAGSGFNLADEDIDAMMAILNGDSDKEEEWINLRAGDIVTVKLIHIPSGKIIFESDVVVEG